MQYLQDIMGIVVDKVYAQANYSQYCAHLPSCGSGNEFMAQLFAGLYNMVVPLFAVSSVLVVIYGGMRLAASAGDEGGKDAAKRIIKFGLIGLGLGMATGSILFFLDLFIITPFNS